MCAGINRRLGAVVACSFPLLNDGREGNISFAISAAQSHIYGPI